MDNYIKSKQGQKELSDILSLLHLLDNDTDYENKKVGKSIALLQELLNK